MKLAEYRKIMFLLKKTLNEDGITDERVQCLYDNLMFMCGEFEKLQALNNEWLDKLERLAALSKGDK
jgi:hypothetical protein